MKPRSFRRSPVGSPDPLMDINTTPLIDVMLVLLIMLIITIPAQLHNIPLDMPIASKSGQRSQVVRVEILPGDGILWMGKPIQAHEIPFKMQEIAAEENPSELHIRPHPGSRYKTLAFVMASAQRSGLKKLGVIGTEQFAND
jgi:biopolymer transport protein ExbD